MLKRVIKVACQVRNLPHRAGEAARLRKRLVVWLRGIFERRVERGSLYRRGTSRTGREARASEEVGGWGAGNIRSAQIKVARQARNLPHSVQERRV
jgi:hypothetical protein